MAKKITKLTPEQTARFGEWVDKWVKVGLSTEPADFTTATKAALEAYKICNLKPPKTIMHVASPYAAILSGVFSLAIQQTVPNVKDIKNIDLNDIKKNLKQFNNEIIYNSYHGSFWASWVAYVSFFRDVVGWDDPVLERFKIEEDLVNSCGWIWWHEEVLVISDRPASINFDEQKRLHNEVGPSIAYRDGWSRYHWHGVAVPSEWITDKASLQAQTVLAVTNLEQRRAGCEILGWDKILGELDATVIDEDNDPHVGKLLQVKLPGNNNNTIDARYLQVQCGTGRIFYVCVPMSVNSALEAQAWMVDLDLSKFKVPEIRT